MCVITLLFQLITEILQHDFDQISDLLNKSILFCFSTLTEALERSKRKYQSKIKKMEQQLFHFGLKDDKVDKIEK